MEQKVESHNEHLRVRIAILLFTHKCIAHCASVRMIGCTPMPAQMDWRRLCLFFFGFRFWLLNKWARWIVYSCVQNDTRDTCISIHLILVYFSMIFGVWHSMDLQPFIKYAGFFFTAVEVATPIIIIERSWWAWLNVDIIGQLNAMFSVCLSSSYFCFLLCFASAVEPYAVFWHWFSATAAGTNWIESNNWLQGRRLC